jgi:biopolymer transport protein ExbD
MIKVKPTKDYLVALESVAMTDIVLNMFIFFFISFSLLYTFSPERMRRVEVNLPTSKSTVSLQGQEKATITLTKEGKVYLGEDAVDMRALKNGLKSRLERDPSLSLILRVDRLARFASVVRVLDVINELGIKRLSVAAMNK